MEACLPPYIPGDEYDGLGIQALSLAATRLDELQHLPFAQFAELATKEGNGSLHDFVVSLAAMDGSGKAQPSGTGESIASGVEISALLLIARLVAGEHECLGSSEAWRARLGLTGLDDPSNNAVTRRWAKFLYESWAIDAPMLVSLAARFAIPTEPGCGPGAHAELPTSPHASRRLAATAAQLVRALLPATLTLQPALRVDLAAMRSTLTQCVAQASAQYAAARFTSSAAISLSSEPDQRLQTLLYVQDTVGSIASALWAFPPLADDWLFPPEAGAATTEGTEAQLLPSLRALAQTTLLQAATDADTIGGVLGGRIAACAAAAAEAVLVTVHVAATWAALAPLGIHSRSAELESPVLAWAYRPPSDASTLSALLTGGAAGDAEGTDASEAWDRRPPRAAGRALLWLVGSLRAHDGAPVAGSRAAAGGDSSRLLSLWAGRCRLRESLSEALGAEAVPIAARSAVRDALSLLPARAGALAAASSAGSARGSVLGTPPGMVRRSSSGGASGASIGSAGSEASRRAAMLGMTPALRAKTLELARLQAFRDEYADEVDDSLAEGTGGAVEASGALHEDERGALAESRRGDRRSADARGEDRREAEGAAAASRGRGGDTDGAHGRGEAGSRASGDRGGRGSGSRGGGSGSRGGGSGGRGGGSDHAGKHGRRHKALQKQGGPRG